MYEHLFVIEAETPVSGARSRRTSWSTQPISWHHVMHFAHGGPTDLGNLVILCRYHHRRLHDEGYRIVRTKNGSAIIVHAEAAPSRSTRPRYGQK